jgi:outer membrane lipoprotein SlyB
MRIEGNYRKRITNALAASILVNHPEGLATDEYQMGAAGGAAIGAFFGGVGAAPGAVIGGFVGGVAGYFTGYAIGGKAYNTVTGN